MRGQLNAETLAIEVYNAMDKHRFEEDLERSIASIRSDYNKSSLQFVSIDDLTQDE